MKNVFFYTLLLVILNSILIVCQKLGINVILFTIPLLIFLYYYLKLNKLIKNKRGLLFFIPIIILSCTYFVYDNIFREFNIVIIPVLYTLMFIYVIDKPSQVLKLLENIIKVFLKPVEYIGTTVKNSLSYFDSKIKLTAETKKKIKAVLIVIPIVIFIFWLLCMADEVFANLFSGIGELIKNISLANSINRIVVMIILFIYMNGTLIFVLNELGKKESKIKNIKTDQFTMKVLLTALNVIYIVFDIIQIKSLFLHSVASNINYAQYARTGFFELMTISLINFAIILLAKHSKKDKYNQAMSIAMIFLTLIIIVSSFYRMNLYEQAYGYTLLRLGVYVSLITEVLLLIPTVFYILKDKMNILNYYIVIVTIVYTFINLFSVDCIIAERNIKRYKEKDDIDIEYLSNHYADNIPILINLRDQLKEEDLRDVLDFYLEDYVDQTEKDNILEYNISRQRALKVLGKTDFNINNYNNTKKSYLEIKLYDNSSTGYKWKTKVSNKGIVNIESYSDYSNCPRDVDGCGGEKIFTISSVQPGHTTVEFQYVGPDEEIDKIIVYEIIVDDKYTIHEKNTKMKQNKKEINQ